MDNIILGVNISHDTSIALVDETTGEVLDVYEEERCRRSKYWDPHKNTGVDKDKHHLQSIYQKNISDAGHLVFSSFDRRRFMIDIDPELRLDRIKSRELISRINSKQMSREDFDKLQEDFPELHFTGVWKKFGVEPGSDEEIMNSIAHQLGRKPGDFAYRINHHVHHAYSGYFLSPYFKEDNEDALIIVWDGGGARMLFDEFPNHQETESIYFGESDGVITPLWRRMSDHRFHGDIDHLFPNDVQTITACLTDEEFTLDDVDYCLTSMPSSGMNFSNMSYALGTDKEGRAAGKVMGMASYGRILPNVFDKHTMSQQLEVDSFEASCKIIQKALDYKPECKNIVLSGGYSLNCTNNYKYLQAFPDINFFVDPIPHDGGTAVGCAIEYYYDMKFNKDEESEQTEGGEK